MHAVSPADRDAELAQRATRSDPAAITDLLASYMPRLRAFVRLRINGALRLKESQSDIVQSVCRELLDAAHTFEFQGEERFRGWLFNTALNKIRERARFWQAEKRAANQETSAPNNGEFVDVYAALHSPSQMAIANELAQKMELAFDQLSDEHREVITLTRIVGLSHAQVADQMNRSLGATRMLLSRALVELVQIVDRIEGLR